MFLSVSALVTVFLVFGCCSCRRSPSGGQAETSYSCGRQQVRSRRIVGGNEVYDGEFPWTVSIWLRGFHFCGGALLAPLWILTAAHCVQKYPASQFRARLGEYDLTRPEPGRLAVDVPISEIILHPNYSVPRRYYNDLALLRLSREVRYDTYIQPICLPQGTNDNYTGIEAQVVGWGWLAEIGQGGKRATKLQKVKVPVMDYRTCQEWYRKTGRHVTFQGSQMCAGYKDGGRDSCQGDSGGPLILKQEDQFTLIGIVSAGIGCARPLLPGLYSRVAAYLAWIRSHIQP